MKQISENISFLPCSESPLSADVYLIKGSEYTYVIDVGACDKAFELVDSIDKKKIIITHFHDDHMKNLARLNVDDGDLYIGDHTRKVLQVPVYSKQGTVVAAPMEIHDGIKLTFFSIPSSHAKGSLGVILDDTYLFMGDSYYCSAKGYNVSLLHDEIRVLKEMSFTKVIMSHDEKIYDRDEVIHELEGYYDRKEKGNPFIKVEYT